MNHTTTLLILAALAVFGVLALIGAAHRRATRAALAAGEAARSVSLGGRVLVTAAVIVGVQVAVIRSAHLSLSLLLVVLGAPALAAAVTLVRALTLTPGSRRGGVRR
jgi:hypothetical protein